MVSNRPGVATSSEGMPTDGEAEPDEARALGGARASKERDVANRVRGGRESNHCAGGEGAFEVAWKVGGCRARERLGSLE